MKSHDNSSLGLRFAPVLARREAELRAILHAAQLAESERADGQDGVTDFKEISAENSLEVVDDAKGNLAAHDLAQVLAALHRLEEGRYGQCLDCGNMIDEDRLTALPAAPYCIACQAMHEQGRTSAGGRATMHLTKGNVP